MCVYVEASKGASKTDIEVIREEYACEPLFTMPGESLSRDSNILNQYLLFQCSPNCSECKGHL